MTTTTAAYHRIERTGPLPPIIIARGVFKHYGDRCVVRDVSLHVDRGEIFGLLGHNGAGKTTTVEILQGLRPPDAGDVRIAGLAPLTDRRRLRRLIGSQLQESALPDRLRVGEALRLFARLAGEPIDWRGLLDEWDLSRLERAAFGTLSGGERQRLFVALALVNDPEIVFLDELTQGLDPAARRETWGLIKRVRDRGATVVLVSHSMDEVEHLCDRLAIMHHGQIAEHGTPSELVARHGGPSRIRFTPSGAHAQGRLRRLRGVHSLTVTGQHVTIECAPAEVIAMVAELHRAEVDAQDLVVLRPTLEDVFLSITRSNP